MALLLVLLGYYLALGVGAEESLSSCETVYLLHVVPFPGQSAGWEGGLEVTPAGRLAVKHINNRTDLLSEQRLAIIDVPSEACERKIVLESINNLYREVLNSSGCIGGVVGLYCSIVTKSIAPLLSHSRYGYVQLTSATSPLIQNSSDFTVPYLFRSVTSTEVLNKAMISMMDKFNWTRVINVYDSVTFYFLSTAINFAELLDSDELSAVDILPDRRYPEVIRSIREEGFRVSYYSVNINESASLMCHTYKEGLLSPGFVFIFLERIVEDFLSVDEELCTRTEMLKAIEGVYVLHYRLRPTSNTTLVSGLSYDEYSQEYREELQRFSVESGTTMTLQENEYGNSLYDQVWAFALAMNNTNILDRMNGSFQATLNATPDVRQAMAREIRKVQFNGATGYINFGEAQEVQTFVDVYQIRDGEAVLVGVFDSHNKELIFEDDFDPQNVPSDTFETVHYYIPLWLGVLVLIAQTLLIALLTFNLTFIIYMRQKPEIKSSSLCISLLIYFGCYLLSFSPIIFTILNTFPVENGTVFAVFCNMDVWFFTIGLSVILVTVFFRLLRIFHIFRSYHATGKYWSDRYLLFYISLVCLISIAIVVVWGTLDPLQRSEKLTYISDSPQYQLRAYCASKGTVLWSFLSNIWIGLVLILVTFLAIQTRHIKRKHYKDTKKICGFTFSVCIIFYSWFPLIETLLAIDLILEVYIIKFLTYFSIVLVCQLFLFMPKILPVLTSSSDKANTAALGHTHRTFVGYQTEKITAKHKSISFPIQ